MEGHEARMALDGQMQRRDVAIANEGLGVAAQQFVVQQVQQAPGAETALQAPDGIDIGGSEGRVQVGRALRVRAGQIVERVRRLRAAGMMRG